MAIWAMLSSVVGLYARVFVLCLIASVVGDTPVTEAQYACEALSRRKSSQHQPVGISLA
jgi:hypothetical protein